MSAPRHRTEEQLMARLASMLEAAAVLLRHHGHPASGCDAALREYKEFRARKLGIRLEPTDARRAYWKAAQQRHRAKHMEPA